MFRAAPAWCRSPATTCRYNIADGIIAEHNHVRAEAGLFDVSHMGQAFLAGADHETVARALETLVPADIVSLAPGPPALHPVDSTRTAASSTT